MTDVIPGVYCDGLGCRVLKPMQTGPWNVDGALGGNIVVYEMNNQCQLEINDTDKSCGDTGVAHLATAYRRPSVVLFGPVAPALWGPPPRPQHVVLWHGDGTGDPWGTDLDPALARITVDEVEGALDELEHIVALRATPPPGAVPGLR